MGSILVNVVATEIVILVSYVILLIIGVDASLIINLLLGMAVVFPLISYHHCWSFWLGFNHLINPLPKLVKDEFNTAARDE